MTELVLVVLAAVVGACLGVIATVQTVQDRAYRQGHAAGMFDACREIVTEEAEKAREAA